MNILMICYYYPPLTDVGSKRSVAFSKYFRKHGWKPFVLSVKNPDRSYCSVGKDVPPEGVPTEYSYSVINPYWLLGKMNGALSRVLKLFGVDVTKNYFYDLVCYPDHFLGWIPLTTLKGIRIIREENIDAIYVSCTPFSGALVGMFLKKLTQKPLILDFRDPFAVGTSTYTSMSGIRRAANRWFEKMFLIYADLFFVTSEETRQAYIKEYPWIEGKTFTIYNGFDPVSPLDGTRKKFDKFSIIYTGQFYNYGPNHQVYTDIFFKALAHLKSAGDISSENFQFQFFGDEYRFIQEMADQFGIKDLVIAGSRVPYQEVLERISQSHLMLLRILKLMISTKLYEGIPLNIPFLATIPHGEVEEIIREYSPGSYIITEDDSFLDAAAAIKDAMAKYRSNQIPANHVEDFLARFTREDMTLKLMHIIENNFEQRTKQ
jgi:glycosyltransferase involved in cell wall biosynthesis